eukprot:TCALIF_10796-PA protein Name:"Similar to Pineal opsin (Petromyzon marinus)" AED:0.10 eAED:0.10 QI:118/0.8/0.83/1/0.8/0.66/6/148/385
MGAYVPKALSLRLFQLQTPFNLVLMNLIVAELLISLIGIPIDLTASLLQGWKLGYHLCLVTGFSMTLLGMVSIFTLSSLAIQRWMLVTRPGKFSLNNWTHTRLNLALIWFLSIAVALPPLLGWSFYAPETSGLSCAPAWEDPKSIGFNWYMLSLGFFLPTSAMVYTSGSVLLNLKVNASNQKAASVIRRSAQKRENKVTRMVMFMMTSFTICWFPYALMCLYRILIGHTAPLMSAFPLLFAKSSICWNPIIYILMNNQFNALLIPKFWRNVSSDDGSHTTNHHPTKPPHIKNRFTSPAPLIGSLSGQTYDMSSKDKPRPDSHNTQVLDQPNSEQIGSIRITFTQPWRDGSKLADMDSTEAVYGDESAYRNKTTIALHCGWQKMKT